MTDQPKPPTADEYLKRLDMDSPINYTEWTAKCKKALNEGFREQLYADLCMFIKHDKHKGPVTRDCHIMMKAIRPVLFQIRSIQAELIQPREMIKLLEGDEDRREKLRKIHHAVFVFHASMLQPFPEQIPVRVTDDEYNDALQERSELMTEEEYTKLAHNVPGFGDLNTITPFIAEMFEATIARANKSMCSVCNAPGAKNCTGCKISHTCFCSAECQKGGTHAAECPITKKQAK